MKQNGNRITMATPDMPNRTDNAAPVPGSRVESPSPSVSAVAPVSAASVPLSTGVARPPRGFASEAEFLAAISTSVGALISYIDREERFRYANAHFAAWFGVTPEALYGKALREVYGTKSYAEFKPHVERCFEGQIVHYEREANRRDGTSYWISVSLAPHRDSTGAVIGIFSSALEVDELKRKSDELHQTLQEVAFHMENSPLAVIEWNGDVIIKRWSPQAERIFGWSAAEAVGKHPVAVGMVHPDTQPMVRALTIELLEGRVKRNRMLAKNFTKDGRVIHCEWYNSAFSNAEGQTTSILSLAQDVTLRIEAEEQLRQMAVNDSLTGLPNRQSLLARLEHALSRAERTGERVGVMFVDLDAFKPVNDTYGHAVGDELLVQVARHLRTCVRASDTVGRMGGDEFVILLETDVDLDTPALIEARVREALAGGFQVLGHALGCSASVGTRLFPDHARDAKSLLASADASMYRNKQRNA
jgi:diguanylate cyclase (GGDEF)-like protein/PAS domain S-box-containing protein